MIEWIALQEDKLADINNLIKKDDTSATFEKNGFEECKPACMVHAG